MTQATLVDGLGQLHTRVYASVADLPAPFLGAFAVVDGGAGGTVYVSLHDSTGTLVWLSWASLLDAILKLPPVGDPNIIDNVDATVAGLKIISSIGLEVVSGNQVGAHVEQTGSTIADAAVRVERSTFTPSEALVQVADGSGVSNYAVNGYGEIVVKHYSTLPPVNASHLGAIVAVGTGGVEDTVYICVLDATSTPAWTNFQGPPGTNGTNGVTPQLRESGGYIQVSYDGGVTWSNLVPLSDITGPAGPGFTLPPLPAPGAAPITFWMPCAGQGQMLPWRLPAGYSVQVVGGWGFWTATGPMEPIFASDYTGSADTTWPSIPDSRYALGRTLFITYDSAGNNYLLDGTHIYNDALTGITVPEDSYVVTTPNVEQSVLFGSIIWVQVTVSPHASSIVYDFTVSDGGWVSYGVDDGCGTPVNNAHYVSGVGWEFPAYVPTCVGRTQAQGTIAVDLGATYPVSSMEVIGYYYGPGTNARQIYTRLATTPPWSGGGTVYVNDTSFTGPDPFDMVASGSASGRYVELIGYDTQPGLSSGATVFLITKIIITI